MSSSEFVPRPDQVDFTHARWAPVVNAAVVHDGRVLLVQRSELLNFYPGRWNGISGFLDDHKGLEEKVREELHEETGIEEGSITSIELCDIFDVEEPKYGKTWVLHAALARVTTDAVTLNEEAQDHVWEAPGEIVGKYELAPGFDRVLKAARARMYR